jgi:hypothetical protein
MKRIGFTFALVAVLAVPATAAAHQSDKPRNPAKHCKALRGESGESASASRRAFGEDNERNAHGKCVSERARLLHRLRHRLKREAFVTAVRQCRVEHAEDPAAFEQKYGAVEVSKEGEERRGSRAFARCVRQKLKEALAALRESFENAAKECKAERAEDRDAFREKYGTNRNRRNALGKCVSQHVKAGDESEPGTGDDPEGTKDRPEGSEDRPGNRPGD